MDKKIIIPGLVSLISAILVFLIFFGILPFGEFLNIFLKCEENPIYSMPCYSNYDINTILFLSVVSLGYLIILILNLYKKYIYSKNIIFKKNNK